MKCKVKAAMEVVVCDSLQCITQKCVGKRVGHVHVRKQTSVVLGLQWNLFYLQMWPFVLNHMLARRVSSAPLVAHLYCSLPVALAGHCPVCIFYSTQVIQCRVSKEDVLQYF